MSSKKEKLYFYFERLPGACEARTGLPEIGKKNEKTVKYLSWFKNSA
jgi:hypothetical protein